jgi:RNA polymerase sigma-54 factor
MLNQTLTLSQTQQLQMILAPQLRQSLEMLQVPILELRAMIQKELEQNPTLEEVPAEPPVVETAAAEIEPASQTPEDQSERQFDKEFEELSRLDDEWKDYFFQNVRASTYSKDDAEKREFMMDSLIQTESLQEHLLSQLNLSDLPDNDKQIGELIIGSINDDGYLTTPISELAISTASDPHHVEDILSVVQDFHPTGVGARDLSECLLVQLERLAKSDTVAASIVREHLDKLGGKKFLDIAKALKITVEDVQQAAKLIATLDPKPGKIFSPDTAEYVLPEVVVQKVDGEYVVIMNDDQLPHVRISKYYRELLDDENTKPEVKTYIRDRIRSSAFIIKSIHQRQSTIYRIACEIVRVQTDFLDHGISRLKPLTMADIAKIVGVHETTVSRAVSGKYMKTPGNIYEMKYFFTPGIRTADGQEVSNKTVRDMLANIVTNEDHSAPLSDQEIMELLKKQGVSIARRTIAKYRLALRIQPSHMRKSG